MTGLSARLAALPPAQREQFAARLGQAADTVAAEPIAIVGMGCRFPGGVHGPDDYWRLLVEGRDGIGPVPADRWAPGTYDEPGMDRGGFLDDVAGFDPDFFGIAPREARAMDPQARLLLEVTWEALEHAGIRPADLAGSNTGVFAGVFYNDYLFRGLRDTAAVDAYNNVGGAHSGTVGRISYLLDLNGPCVAVDTACSSSLVALHQACQSLRLRESDLALVGGASLVLDPGVSLSLSRFGVLSPGGACKTFDASADGIVRSEGAGAVVLKRLSDAVRDGDRLLAVVAGSAVNADGRSQGLTAPSGRAQRAVLQAALARSGVAAGSVGLVETHGTGTALGDPIEVEALAGVYGRGEGRCALGAVKTNLGHLEGAAGVASVIKAVLCMQHGEIPANLHFDKLNPDIELGRTRFFVPTENMPWPVPGDGPRTAAASSFGMGGTNAHVVLEQAPVLPPAAPAGPGPVVTVVSARSEAGLAENASRLASWVAPDGAEVADVAYTLTRRRPALEHRVAVVASSGAELAAGLTAYASGEAAPGVVAGTVREGGPAGPVWLFAGHGAQWTGMGAELLATEPAFAAAVDEIAPVFADEAGIDLRAALVSEDLGVAGADRIQPLVFAVQVGLAAVWRSYGVRPAAVIGHSMGEISAAVAAGALSAADGARLICRRSALLRRVVGRGAMAVVALPADEVERRLAARGDGVAVAILAAPASTVVAGEPAAVEALVADWAADGVTVRKVASDVAFHSPQMDPLRDQLAVAVTDLTPSAPTARFYSTALDDPRGAVRFDGGYWSRNLRAPVRFAAAVAAAAADGHRVFVELSPHPLVTHSVKETLAAGRVEDGVAVAGLRRDAAGTTLLAGLAAVYCAGLPVDLERLAPDAALADAPTTAWQKSRYWLDVADLAPVADAAPTATPPEWLHALDWPVRAPAGGGEPGSWLVVADSGGVGDAFAAAVTSGSATVLPAADLSGLDEEALAERLGPLDGVTGILTCAALDGADLPAPERSRTLTLDLLRLARVVHERPTPPRLRVVTRLAQATGGEETLDPAAATLWGLGRGLAVEHPASWGGLVDVGDLPPAEAAAQLLAEITANDGEDQVAWRPDGRHVARIVPARLPGQQGRLDGLQLVVGATGTVGPYLLPRLVELGADHLVLVSRRGVTGPAADVVADLRTAGVTVTEVAADVADEAAMTALFARFGSESGGDLPPLRGIWNAALAGGDSPVDLLGAPELDAVLRAKVDGTLLLDRLAGGHDLGAFVLFSTTTALLGTRGLAHYGAACAFLDTYAAGRPGALAVNFGAFRAWFSSAEARERMEHSGMRPMDDAAAVAAFGPLLAAGTRRQVVASVDWPQVAAAYRSTGRYRILDEVAPPETGGGSDAGDVAERVRAATGDTRRRLVADHVRAVVADVMGFPSPRTLGAAAGFFSLGMDSLMSVRAHGRLAADLDVDLAPAAVFNHPTVGQLTDHLLELLGPDTAGEPEPAPEDDDEDELVRRLTARLESLQ